MVSALDSTVSGPGLSPGWGHCVVFLGKTLYSDNASLHPVYKLVLRNLMLGVTLQWTSIPSRGEEKYSWSLHATETVISFGLMSHLARVHFEFPIFLVV